MSAGKEITINVNIRQSRIFFIAGFLAVYCVLVFLASRYNDAPIGHWQSEIHNDKAGYYVYLPATFIHGFHYSDDLEEVRAKLSGFKFIDGKLYTKYPMGVAVLVLPFFLVAHLAALSGAGPADGFSAVYYEMTYFASVFYFMLGVLFLFKFLRKRFTMQTTLITLALVVLATNAYYYGLRDPLFSHIYSFFLFSLLLWLAEILWEKPTTKKFLLAAVVSGMIFLVRPLNIIFLPVLLFLGLSSFGDFKNRLRFIFRPVNFAGFILLFFLVILPQLLYWRFLSGSLFFYSYGDEGFIYWNSPKVKEVLFSPNNGLLLYSPAYLLMFAGMVVMIFRREADRWVVPAIILLLGYMVSSWHSFHFGCGFGQRSFVDFLPLMAIPAASLVRWLSGIARPVFLTFLIVITAYLVYVSLSISTIYPKCYVKGFWDWEAYWYYYYEAKVFPVYQQRDIHTWQEDFEDQDSKLFSRRHTVESASALGGRFVEEISQATEYSDSFMIDLDTLVPPGILLNTEIRLNYNFTGPPGKVLVVCSLEKNKEIFFYKTFSLHEEPGIVPGQWRKARARFHMMALPTTGLMKIYLWKMEGDGVLIDDIRVTISSY